MKIALILDALVSDQFQSHFKLSIWEKIANARTKVFALFATLIFISPSVISLMAQEALPPLGVEASLPAITAAGADWYATQSPALGLTTDPNLKSTAWRMYSQLGILSQRVVFFRDSQWATLDDKNKFTSYGTWTYQLGSHTPGVPDSEHGRLTLKQDGRPDDVYDIQDYQGFIAMLKVGGTDWLYLRAESEFPTTFIWKEEAVRQVAELAKAEKQMANPTNQNMAPTQQSALEQFRAQHTHLIYETWSKAQLVKLNPVDEQFRQISFQFIYPMEFKVEVPPGGPNFYAVYKSTNTRLKLKTENVKQGDNSQQQVLLLDGAAVLAKGTGTLEAEGWQNIALYANANSPEHRRLVGTASWKADKTFSIENPTFIGTNTNSNGVFGNGTWQITRDIQFVVTNGVMEVQFKNGQVFETLGKKTIVK